MKYLTTLLFIILLSCNESTHNRMNRYKDSTDRYFNLSYNHKDESCYDSNYHFYYSLYRKSFDSLYPNVIINPIADPVDKTCYPISK